MASDSINKISQIIEIEDDVIDLDETDKTAEDVIYEWDANIRKKLSKCAVADNENVLGDLMKEYLQSLKDMWRSYEDNETLKNKVFYHISFLYSYFVELQCCTADNYLVVMEDILTLYCNLALEVIRPLKRKDFSEHKYKKRIVSVGKKLIQVLTVYLLERHDHILHVLIKMNTNKNSDSASEVLKILYRHFLIKVPAFDLCDESFCRSYIVFQKFKEIRNIEDWEKMDKCMYAMFKRTPESIKESETLRRILMPSCSSTVDVVLSLFRSHHAVSSAYFQHLATTKNIDVDDLDFNIDLGEDEPTVPVNNDNEEEVQFMKEYYKVERSMSNLPHVINTSDIQEIINCKEELDEDEDVQFIGITMPPEPPLLNLTRNQEKDDRMNNIINNLHMELDRIPLPPSPLRSNSTLDKNSDIGNFNGIKKMPVVVPTTISETSSSCQSSEMPPLVLEPPSPIPAIDDSASPAMVVSTTNQPKLSEVPPPVLEPPNPIPAVVSQPQQPKVSFPSNDKPAPPIVSSEVKTTEVTSDCSSVIKRTVEMKSIEVQANYSYDDHGVTTPPFEVQGDEQTIKSVENQLFPTTTGQNDKNNIITPEKEKRVVSTQTVEVQVDSLISKELCPYDDYGLTPPNDTHLEDNSGRLQEPLYTDLSHKGSLNKRNVDETHRNEIPPVDKVAQEYIEEEEEEDEETEDVETENYVVAEPEVEDELNVSETVGGAGDDDDTEEIDVESCQETDDNSEIKNADILLKNSKDFERSDQIDTGQAIENEAPNIPPVTADLELKEIYNGNIVLKPLTSSNRTNGQAKDNNATKIMYTSSQKLTSLEDFSRFENAIHNQWNERKENHDFDDILSGPVSKAVPVKSNNLFTCQEKMDLFGQESNSKVIVTNTSRSSSPSESPAYEGIEDFRHYFTKSVNGRVPTPHDIQIPPSILKKDSKDSRTRRRNVRVTFHTNTNDNSEERRPRSVLIPKRIGKDPKLNMEATVLMERFSFIEDKLKFEKCFVRYDKSNNLLSEKDERRYIPDPQLTWIINSATSNNKRNPGKVDSVKRTCKKTPPSGCEDVSCCKTLAEQFTKLSCDVCEEKALNLTIPADPSHLNPEFEFSNSPTFLPNREILQHCLEETSEAPLEVVQRKSSLLCDNSNFYTTHTVTSNELNESLLPSNDNNLKTDTVLLSSNDSNLNSVKTDTVLLPTNDNNCNLIKSLDGGLLQLPTAVPDSYDFEKVFKNDVFSKIDWQIYDDSDGETRLPLKKRKLSVANNENVAEEAKKEEISYPATPMISIAEVEALHPRKLQASSSTRPFKTPAERKEMPPLPVFYSVDSDPSPIITDQFNINNHTYNNPTINYHMNHVPVPFINIPCGSYYSLPPILLPFNNVSTFDQSKLNQQQQQQEGCVKSENKRPGRRRRH